MRCNEARMLAVDAIGADRPVDRARAEHMRACIACARWLEQARLVHGALGDLQLPPPEQLAEIVEEGIADGLKAADRPRTPPAKPDPERSGTQKAAIFILALIGLLAMTLALMLGLRFEGEPAPKVAAIARQDGQCEIRTPGTDRWRELGRGDFLPPGTQLRTGPDSIMVFGTRDATISLPPMTAVSIPEEGVLELVVGRLLAEVKGGNPEPFEFVTANGRATCEAGAFTAAVTLKRLRIVCVSGEVQLAGEGDPVPLGPGESAMMYEGQVSGPLRAVDPGGPLHWLGLMHEYEGRRLVPRQMALVAIPPGEPPLPAAVAPEGVVLSFYMRGPLAVVRATVHLRNSGEEGWEGSVSLRDVLLPPPLAAVGGEDVVLPAGGATDVELAALCALRNRSDYYGIGVNPAGWAERVGNVRVLVDAAADGGIREFLAPTLRPRMRKTDHVAFQEESRDDDPPRPIILEMRLDRDGADAIALTGGQEGATVSAFRMDADRDPWLSRERRVFLAFDATGDFGRGGRLAAHEVLEGLIGALPPGCTTALIAFDGTVKFAPDKLMLHLPARAESMLDRLWQLDRQAGQEPVDPARFLAGALLPVTGLEGESIVVLVTGRQDPGDVAPCREQLREGRTRLAVLQVGTDRPAAAYRSLCAETGGVALAIPPGIVPDLGVLDFLTNLPYPAVWAVDCSEGPAGLGSVLAGPADFADQPVVALMRAAGGSTPVLSVRFAGRRSECNLAEPPQTVPLPAAQAAGLLRLLRGAKAP
jgi:hypothetical protein